ncbi:hypothetical protein COU62_03745 [Candidatus Pacearchaeota archaeon CG10_big_fil_rev_8_21_14_0_10_35_219]|nr:hypothetical protein [Candidatus Pacearchaeota archaeon]OIO42303.1 MAG: hypothetical protein AUJ63_03430 [Candidatus Pacearchaeota archaeon CG1_02_35_32]PIO07464.1 MAG: hypothetical protein COU62_03745 [Candidatus Pacearchaeota archaeon CG10_big_fil_rev_8_21_14_0_10_35_219]PIY81270.1 MAG: hypothetical protein COY79_03240 [Candidatus Pacearchaeota archaeon CG_4_10_14_0_8_um_filter_35_169]PIZ80199.1 MAG: hypothetical protein COY00_01885 [Candidatus Pacearchaeota archaeon CG_4_10_14_0_2_um_filt
MLLVIRIKGLVNVSKKLEEALFRLRLRRKYSAILLEDNTENRKILNFIRNYVSYGPIKKEMIEKLIKERGVSKKGKIDAKKVVEGLERKNLDELGLKPFFRLHPPRGGIESKKHAGVGKGVLGENKKINELLGRML